jgi:hypothetical protein
VRSATAARLVLGGACLAAPGGVLAVVGGPDRDDPTTRLAARVLGGRLVLQAAADLALGPRTSRVGALVELTHAASMLPVAVRWPEHRRTALVSAAAAATIAVLDLGP